MTTLTPSIDIKKLVHTPDIPDSHGINFFKKDPELQKLLKLYLGEALYNNVEQQLDSLGQRVSDELDDLALIADKNPPTLQYRTRQGDAIQKILKHPSFIALEKVAYSELGLAAICNRPNNPAKPLLKYALTYLFVQAEFGLCCPVSMTDSLTHTLSMYGSKELLDRYLPHLASQDFEQLYQGAMFMTEQAAGSDVGGIDTYAELKEGEWYLTGEKWFCSNPDADLAMILARPIDAPAGLKGLGLFLLPKRLEDGSLNNYQIVRLKDKLGTRSMASGEINLQGAKAYLLGEIGRGFQQMAEMINMSRLSNGVRSAGLMRRALTEALHVTHNRRAFGKFLVDMPLMQRQLLKIMLPTEQARSMVMQTTTCLEKSWQGDSFAQKVTRILTPMIKFRACRDARKVTGDAMEVRGGVGYIEEWSDPRIVRDAHLGSIWEGTSNIVALDVIRAAQRSQALEPLQEYLTNLLNSITLPEVSKALFTSTLEKVIKLVKSVIDEDNTKAVRQAASALYHITTAIFMAWEAVQLAPDYRRLAISHLVLKNKLLPQDPLLTYVSPEKEAIYRKLLNETPLSLEEAMLLI